MDKDSLDIGEVSPARYFTTCFASRLDFKPPQSILACWGSLGMNKKGSLYHFSFLTLQRVWAQTVTNFSTFSTTRAVPCGSRTLFSQAHLLHLACRWNSFLITFFINLVPFHRAVVQGTRGMLGSGLPLQRPCFFLLASPLGRCLSYVRQVNNFHNVKLMIAAPAATCHRSTMQRPFSLKH